MAAYESGEKPPLQGVSQQIPRERLPGQCTAQENMLSDPVQGLRRRPGAEYKYSLTMAGATADKVLGWFTDVAGKNVHVVLNLADGTIKLLDEAYAVLATLAGGSYLTSTVRKNIRATVVGDEIFLVNTAIKPVEVAAGAGVNPDKRGFFYVVSGAFNQTYTVTATSSVGTYTATYTTPNGTGAGDAALSTPDYIAGQLRNALNTNKATVGLTIVDVGEAYVYVQGDTGTTGVKITSSLSSVLMTVSRDSYVTSESQLPAKLPASGDDYIMRVGDVKLPRYYRYESTLQAWLESGAFASPAGLDNMPISIQNIAGVWSLNTADYEGRLAGDALSNPVARFVEFGITGLGSFQGRLVLLSGAQVYMSASGKPRRFYRSTVVSLLDSDTIHIGSSANSSAAYEYCIPYQKDLLLFSSKYQALVPAGNVAITPRTATVIVTSGYGADMESSPVTLGRSIMYPAPRSADFFGMLEMIPSPSTESQYVSVEVTPHLPKYMGGRCRFGVSSTTANMAMFSPTTDKKTLIVHEYQWDGDKKSQQAWHRWTFKYDIASAYFTGDDVHILFVANGVVVAAAIDPKTGVLTSEAERRPFLDLYAPVSIVDHVVTVPAWLLSFDPTVEASAKLVVRSGNLAGSLVGATPGDGILTTVLSHPTGDVYIGLPYTSTFSPTSPAYRDQNGAVVGTNKATLLRYLVGTANSQAYDVLVKDAASPSDAEAVDAPTLYWSSSELELGFTPEANESVAVIPCRTNANTTTIVLSTSGVGEMNVVSLDHVMKYQAKIRRRTI